MAYVIDKETCIACGECEGECPMSCIAPDGDKYAIDPETCISCGVCAGTCPQEAISEE